MTYPTPRATDGDLSKRRCRRCGKAAVADENNCRKCGSFLRGNQSGLVHGGRRRTIADPRETELYQAWAADLGGAEELTAGQDATLCRIAEADSVARTAFDFLSRTSETLASDRVQKAVSTLAMAASTFYRGAQILGLQRKAKAATLADAINDRQQAGVTP